METLKKARLLCGLAGKRYGSCTAKDYLMTRLTMESDELNMNSTVLYSSMENDDTALAGHSLCYVPLSTCTMLPLLSMAYTTSK